MKILVFNGLIVGSADSIEFGAWEERDITNGVVTHKWKLADENGNTLNYHIDANLNAIDGTEQPIFTVHEVTEIPEGAEQGKYLYVDGEFVQNPDWVEPPKSDAERLAELESALQQSDETAIELFELTMAQEEINNAQDDAIIEIFEMLTM